MPTRRQRRLNDLFAEELQLLIPGRLDDPRLVGVSVTRVESTQDLSTIKVYVTCMGGDAETAEALQALAHSEGFLRDELTGLGLRRLPHLVFARDKQFESGQRVLDILEHLDDSPASEADDADPAQS